MREHGRMKLHRERKRGVAGAERFPHQERTSSSTCTSIDKTRPHASGRGENRPGVHVIARVRDTLVGSRKTPNHGHLG
jgi:hypothetical protein